MTPARLALAALAALLVSPAAAQPAQDPDWPCVQRRTPSIDLAQVWNGPDPAAAGKWTDDQDAATLAQRLASRRTPLEDVDGLLDAYLRQAGDGARDGLLRVMAGVYEILNTERSRIVSGIERYARGQQKLADRIREEGDKVSAAKASGAATPEATSLEEQLKWDSRIFDERARSLTYVCETPVLLEQRAYAIGEKIAARLNGR